MRRKFRFNYQPIWNTLDRSCFEKTSNHSTEQELLPFLIEDENDHPKDPNLLENNTENKSQVEFLPNINIRAYPAKRLTDDNTDEISTNHSMVTEKRVVTKSQSPTQTTSDFSNAIISNTETKKSKFQFEVTGFTPP